jgi:hypothetical protein
MCEWLSTALLPLRRYVPDQNGQADVILIALIAFMVTILVTRHRIVAQ